MRPRQVVVRILRVILGLFCVIDGVVKLTGISKTVELFERIGWGQWFRYFCASSGLVLRAEARSVRHPQELATNQFIW
jgi:hypothetical protein